MKIYHYHQDTREYIGSDTADPDPLDKGKWLVPAYATLKEPPAILKNKMLCFENDQWIYKEKPAEPKPFDPKESWTYAEYRAYEYPPITEYLDSIVKGDQSQLDKYISDCLLIKQKYPKPE